MSENMNLNRSELEKNQQLKLELDSALELVKHYESLIAAMQADHKKSVHDLSNPLQIISMTMESLEERIPAELMPSFERMKRSADAMTAILVTMRKIRSSTETSKLTRVV